MAKATKRTRSLDHAAETVRELLYKAVVERNSQAASKLVDHLRFRRGMGHEAIYQFVNLRHPVSRAEWDALL